MTKKELIDFCLSLPGAYEDYPFGDDWCVMRYSNNKKGFAHIFEMDGLLYINLKCDPQESDFLRKAYRNITPAYHMNKTHWNSVITDGDVPVKEIKRMIESSYNLVKPKRTKSNKTGRNN